MDDLTSSYAKDGQRGAGGRQPGELSVLLRDATVSLNSRTGAVELRFGNGSGKH